MVGRVLARHVTSREDGMGWVLGGRMDLPRKWDGRCGLLGTLVISPGFVCGVLSLRGALTKERGSSSLEFNVGLRVVVISDFADIDG